MGSRCWVVLCALLVLAATKECRAQTEEEDEKRPYKFAFSIEGYQHRSEQKDEKGIIMGEFGFVTGDGVYHVTVYATDENGDFKILKMKNYYVGLPGEGTTAAPSRAPPLAPTTQTTASPAPRPSTTTSPIIKHLQGLMGCSGCIVPDKNGGGPSTHSGEGLIDERFGGRPAIYGTAGESPRKPEPFLGGSEKPGFPLGKPADNEKPQGVSQGFGGGSSPGFGGGSTAASPGKGQQGGGLPQPPTISQFGQGNIGQRPPLTVGSPQVSQPQGGSFPAVNEYGGGPGSSPGSSGGTPGAGQYSKSSAKTPSGSPGSGQFAAPSPGSPTGSGQASKRGENVEGLPPGLSVEDMMALLYKFNYTLKYHGHHEKGYRSGDKEGGYFFNGRDGLGRNVEYLANEFGFQPNITLVDLGLSAPDTPKEPEEPNELKDNEFKWYYNR